MGVYREYLEKKYTFEELTRERKVQLARIAELRGREVLVMAADVDKSRAPIGLRSTDLLSVQDLVDGMSADNLDLIIETPGGSGEAAEDIVRFLRNRFKSLSVIVPGLAKSAGTIIAMSGDEILMDQASALGPIDAQITWQGKVFSAEALLQGFEKIKTEVMQTKSLNLAFVPILQNLSPGELQHAQNALDFAKELVREWLADYKFANWTVHSSTGALVTPAERRARAAEIAEKLCDHSRWKTHARSIRIADLLAMRLKVTNFAEQPELADAIRRFRVLLALTFESNIYKLFETRTAQVFKFETTPNPGLQLPGPQAASIVVGATCGNCKHAFRLQGNFDPAMPLESGNLPFPDSNKLKCPNCSSEVDVTLIRKELEAQAKKRLHAPAAAAGNKP